MEVFCFIPVESLPQRRSRKPFISRRSNISSILFFNVAELRPFSCPKYSTISYAVRRGYSAVAVERKPQCCRVARAVRAQQPVDLAWPADEAHIVNRPYVAALFVLEGFAQVYRFNQG